MVPERKPSYSAVSDDMPSSSKPVIASATLTFVPDDEVKKIVTRPQVDNSSNICAEKPMLLRDRRSAAAQGSPYFRMRAPNLSGQSDPAQEAQGNEEVKDEKKLDSCKEYGADMLGVSAPAVKKNVYQEKKEEGQPYEETSHPGSKASTDMTASADGKEYPTGKEEHVPTKALTEQSSSTKLDVKPKIEFETSLPKDQTAETNSSVCDNVTSTNTSGTTKAGITPPLIANSSSGKKVVSAGQSITVSSNDTVIGTKGNTLNASGTASEVSETKQEVEEPVFRLGSEGNYSSYVNQFASNALALTKQQHLDQRDKRRSVTHKFSLNEFKWQGDVNGSKEVILNTLRFSIVGLENSIATSFMHPSWPLQRSTWVRAVHMSKTPQEFAAALSFLQSSIRPICYLNVWNDAVGHVELHRVVSEARQTGPKKKDHKEDEEEPELESKGFGMS